MWRESSSAKQESKTEYRATQIVGGNRKSMSNGSVNEE